MYCHICILLFIRYIFTGTVQMGSLPEIDFKIKTVPKVVVTAAIDMENIKGFLLFWYRRGDFLWFSYAQPRRYIDMLLFISHDM